MYIWILSLFAFCVPLLYVYVCHLFLTLSIINHNLCLSLPVYLFFCPVLSLCTYLVVIALSFPFFFPSHFFFSFYNTKAYLYLSICCMPHHAMLFAPLISLSASLFIYLSLPLSKSHTFDILFFSFLVQISPLFSRPLGWTKLS